MILATLGLSWQGVEAKCEINWHANYQRSSQRITSEQLAVNERTRLVLRWEDIQTAVESVNKQHSRAATTFRQKPLDSSQSPSDPVMRAVQLKHWLTAAVILHGFMSAETRRQSDYRGTSKTNVLEITFINHNNINKYYLKISWAEIWIKYNNYLLL